MKRKNEFLKYYTEVPDKKGIRKLIRAIVLFMNVFNYAVLYCYYDGVLNLPTSHSITFSYVQILIIFDLLSVLFYIFPNELSKFTYLYSALSFYGSSIMYLFMSFGAFRCELNEETTDLIIGISLLLYIIIMAAVILNIKNKIENSYNRKSVNMMFGITISALAISIGMILSKQTKLNFSYFALVLLMSAYLLEPTVSGFHKFYLLIKGKDK